MAYTFHLIRYTLGKVSSLCLLSFWRPLLPLPEVHNYKTYKTAIVVQVGACISIGTSTGTSFYRVLASLDALRVYKGRNFKPLYAMCVGGA